MKFYLISCGGNLLLNIGPTKEGTIAPVFEERLRQLGFWLSINGEAIYESIPWKFQNDTTNPDVWYTMSSSDDDVYAILLKYPTSTKKVVLSAPSPTGSTVITLLGYNGQIQWVGPPKGGSYINSIFIIFVVLEIG
jgi:alpha-L-fucosidase